MGAIIDSIGLANMACGLLIIIYAWDRFNTPPSNRSSTRRILYWWSCAGYILCALTLFAVVSSLLYVPGWREFLNLKDQTIPVPLLATLAMTTLLPSVPVLKRVDQWLLALFFEWGAIPAEVRRRSAALTPSSFTVTTGDIGRLKESFEGEYGDTFAAHLRHKGTRGLARSELRFTRVVKLYDQTRLLAGQAQYERFFDEVNDEFAELERQIGSFIRRSVISLDRAEWVPPGGTIGGGDLLYEQFVGEWHERFAQDCRDNFILLARFLARAVLRSEPTEQDIVTRLRAIGFAAIEPMNTPEFPINSLTLLGIAIALYLGIGTVVFSYRAGGIDHLSTGLLLAAKVGSTRLLTIGLTIWLMQRYPFFRREPGQQRPYFAYLVNAVVAAFLAAGICGLFDLSQQAPPSVEDVRISMLSAVVCFAVAICCDNWPADSEPPRWLRPIEAIGCGAAMVMGTTSFYFLGWAPDSGAANMSATLFLVLWISMPTALAMVIGGFVPHIYRGARRAAAARRREAAQHHAVPLYEPRRLITSADLPPPPATRHRRSWSRQIRRTLKRAA